MPQLGFYRISFEKTIAIFQISTLEYVKMLSFIQKERPLNLAPEMLDLVIFGMKFEDLQICQNAKTKALDLGPKILYLVIFVIEFETASSKSKVLCKRKNF